MLRVGLTGGIACGKSTVAKMFSDLGARVIQSDTIAHELYRPGEPVYEEVVKRFGRDIVKPGGGIDRAKLAAIVFGQGKIDELNKIVHPAVIQHQGRWIYELASKEPDAVAMVEAALIFEAKTNTRFEKMIVVTCQPEQKVRRFAQRTGTTDDAARAEVERRAKVQISDQEKVRRADYVIDNSGPLAVTQQQVEKIYAELKALAKFDR
jgi:dephospho-CoA kinase